MKKLLFLSVLVLFLGFGLVSCSSKKSEPSQESVEVVEEEITDVEASTQTDSGNQLEATIATNA